MLEQLCLDEALLDAAKEVFETMVFMSIEECTDMDSHVEGESMMGSITFRITFEGSLDGCMSICCATPCAKIIAANMLALEPGEDISESEVGDAIGEITNMVMGSVKSRVQDRVGNLDVSIPTVVTGRELESSLGDRAMKIPVRTLVDGEHLIEFTLLCKERR